MFCKTTKTLAFCMAIVMAFLAIYTIVIGAELWYCSFCIEDSKAYMSSATADKVYRDMNERRREISNKSEYADILCNSSLGVRFVFLLFELAAAFTSGMLWILIKAEEEERAERIRKYKESRKMPRKGTRQEAPRRPRKEANANIQSAGSRG